MTLHVLYRHLLTASIVCTIFALASPAAFSDTAKPDPRHNATPLRLIAADSAIVELNILFVGNSYTYGNNLPGMVRAMLNSPGLKANVEKATGGGYTLQRHFEEGNTAKVIGSRKWDIVVMQEQSMRPCVEPQMTARYAAELDKLIDKTGAQTVFFLTWARQHIPQMQDGLDHTYYSVAERLDAKVAPVGRAWKAIREASPTLALHRSDKSHAAPAGTYLAACVFYATITGRSPVGLPAELTDGTRQLVKINPVLAKRLQTAAWKTVCSSPPKLDPSATKSAE